MARAPFEIGGSRVAAGSRAIVELPLPKLYTHTPMAMPVHVVHGRRDGPRLFVCAAIHGDELNGVEVVRRLLASSALARLRGTLVAVPIVNVYGVLDQSRYLPDRRDLNRCFPGSQRGSLGARIAHLLIDEVVSRCTHGIDLHTAAIHRSNLPQVRARLDDAATLGLAGEFGVPVLINAEARDGSLREAAADRGMPMLLYEAGEGLRVDEFPVRVGVRGILNVMGALGMLPPRRVRRRVEPFVAHSSRWERAPASGLFTSIVRLGDRIALGQVLGRLADPFGDDATPVIARSEGILIGYSRLPLVLEGEALFHVAGFADAGDVAEEVQAFTEHHGAAEIPGIGARRRPPDSAAG
jgi:predicted deacylase